MRMKEYMLGRIADIGRGIELERGSVQIVRVGGTSAVAISFGDVSRGNEVSETIDM